MDITYTISLGDQTETNPSLQPHVYTRPDGKYSYTFAIDRPQYVTAHCSFVDIAQALQFAAIFPKWVRVRTSGLSGAPGFTACLRFDVCLSPDGTNAGVNETGIKRIKAFITKARAAGHSVTYDGKKYANSSPLDAEGYGCHSKAKNRPRWYF